MAFVAKEWKDRLVEYAGRRKLKNVATGEETVYDVSRQEGAVSQAGDAFAAETMNDLEQRISDEFNQINQNLQSIRVVLATDFILERCDKIRVLHFNYANYGNIKDIILSSKDRPLIEIFGMLLLRTSNGTNYCNSYVKINTDGSLEILYSGSYNQGYQHILPTNAHAFCGSITWIV